jgi:Papain family cysteine protease
MSISPYSRMPGLLATLLIVGCDSTSSQPNDCIAKCNAITSNAAAKVCGTDGMTYTECEWQCTPLDGVQVFPGECQNGMPPPDGPPYPADGKTICDWVKVDTEWKAVECSINLKSPTDDAENTLDGTSSIGSMGMQMPIPPEMQAADVDHRMRFGPVKNQGSAGACTAFAATATLEGAVRSELTTITNLSEMHLWSRYFEGQVDSCITAAKKGGLATAADADAAGFAYDAMLANAWENKSASPDPSKVMLLDSAGKFQVASIDVLTNTAMNGNGEMVPSTDTIKTALAEGRDVWIALFTSEQWNNPQNGVIGDYNFSGKDGHAVALVGYRTMGTLQFLMRNSWGNTWADGGYAWISADSLQKNLMSAFTVNVQRAGQNTAPACGAGQAVDLGGTCRMICSDGAVADEMDMCRAQPASCAAGEVADVSGACVAACQEGTMTNPGYKVTCTARGCTWNVDDGAQGCAAGPGMTCDKFCPAPTCQVITRHNELGQTIWTCAARDL